MPFNQLLILSLIVVCNRIVFISNVVGTRLISIIANAMVLNVTYEAASHYTAMRKRIYSSLCWGLGRCHPDLRQQGPPGRTNGSVSTESGREQAGTYRSRIPKFHSKLIFEVKGA